MPTTITDQAREQRARRKARRQGLRVCKSRRDGSFMLVDGDRNWVAVGGSGPIGCEFGLWLDELERALAE